MPEYTFRTTCINSTAKKINDMTDAAKPTTWRAIKANCEWADRWADGMGYVTRGKGLRIEKDFAISFHKSTYDGKPCYYIDHSRIEHVWTKG